MVSTLISLSWRVGTTAANLAIGTAARGAGLALSVVRAVVPSDGTAPQRETEDVFESRAEPIEESPPTARISAEPLERGPAIDYDAEPRTPLDESSTAAKTIDDEPELVAEFAEPGAEDGASAEVEIDEPWDGYDDLSADQVIARIDRAGPAELAVLELYEQAHKERRTVLSAAEARQRALQNAPE